ncbi:hypothetical protein P2B19_20230, partial [Xanthomonas perforans]
SAASPCAAPETERYQPGRPPDDTDAAPALPACAPAEGRAAPFPQAPSPALPPELLAQCLDAAGFAPPPPPPPPPFQPRR